VPNTAVILKKYYDSEKQFRLILKLAVSEDERYKKNSIITFMKISEKKFEKYLRNKKILYKSE
jgi:plasmid maintenance system antidote protein VapI